MVCTTCGKEGDHSAPDCPYRDLLARASRRHGPPRAPNRASPRVCPVCLHRPDPWRRRWDDDSSVRVSNLPRGHPRARPPPPPRPVRHRRARLPLARVAVRRRRARRGRGRGVGDRLARRGRPRRPRPPRRVGGAVRPSSAPDLREVLAGLRDLDPRDQSLGAHQRAGPPQPGLPVWHHQQRPPCRG
ncbi:hypothetical protein PAHAL_7G183900 [Panicum hallii]|uniref:Uncharacterized protein n=1 Tax=Panicum hallii TaxID=206008 RepID=A0A2S3I7H1_9POAL|nr:hypothetical protein PAHAL_7G183900 [Panicum hallii]